MLVWLGGLLTSGMRSMCSVQGPASSLNCPTFLVLEFQSIENESPVALPSGEGSPYTSYLNRDCVESVVPKGCFG